MKFSYIQYEVGCVKDVNVDKAFVVFVKCIRSVGSITSTRERRKSSLSVAGLYSNGGFISLRKQLSFFAPGPTRAGSRGRLFSRARVL